MEAEEFVKIGDYIRTGEFVKIGDYVRILHRNVTRYGRVGIISNIQMGQKYPFEVEFLDTTISNEIYNEDELEPISDEEAMLWKLESA